ncbi:MAG: RHS repeat-associated core domain-containing protein [Bacteroidota bacterium]
MEAQHISAAKATVLAYIVFFVCNMSWSEYAHAQERSTQAPEIHSFFLNPDLKGAGQNSVNLYSGDVNLPVNLLSIQGRGGLGANVSAFYTSNIQHQRDIWALEAPTSILGLGWSMNYDRIVVDHKNTGTVHDDDFYLVSGGSSNPLIMTSSTGANGGTKTFETKNYQFWKITYYKPDERWEIIKEDGTTYIFGGGRVLGPDGRNYTSTGNSIQWGVKWRNWIGSSMRTSGQQQHAIAWNLSAVRNTWGDELTYTYLAVEEAVGRYGQPDNIEPKKHTKASYLQSITTPEGQQARFVYGDKSPDEYTDPHQELGEPYGLVVSVDGPNTVYENSTHTYTTNVGNESGALSYLWQLRYVDDDSTPWLTQGTTPDLAITFAPMDSLSTAELKVTVSDAAGKTRSIVKGIAVKRVPDISDCEGRPNPSICDKIDESTFMATPTGDGLMVSLIDPGSGQTHVHYEPDAYQEKYETKYLNRIEVHTASGVIRYYIDFGYAHYGTAGQPDYKRLLTRITHKYPDGEALPSLDMSYYGSADPHPAALEKVIYPGGAEITYIYEQNSLSRTNQYVAVTPPETTVEGGYEKPMVYHSTDYVVFTWRNNSDELIIKLLHWIGEWKEYKFGPFPNAGKLHSGDRVNYSITLQNDFFAILSEAPELTSSKTLYTYHKDEFTNSWLSDIDVFSFTGSRGEIASGKHFIAVIDLEEGTTYRKIWTGSSWEDSSVSNVKYSSDNNYFIGGTNNYYIEDNEGLSGLDEFTVYYLDELRQWGATSPQTFNQFHSSTSNKADINYIHAGNSIFGLSLAHDGEGIGTLSEFYVIQNASDVPRHNDHAPVHLVGNQSIVFSEYDGTATDPDHYRFDGISWINRQIPWAYFSLSPDVIIERTDFQTGRYVRFNPNVGSWQVKETLSDYSNDRSLPQAGIRHFSFGKKLYQVLTNGSPNYLGRLDVYQAGDSVANEKLRFGSNFLAYKVKTPTQNPGTFSFNGANVTILKNGSEQLGPFRLHGPDGSITDNRAGELVSSRFISELIGTSSFGLYYVSKEKVNGRTNNYPVTRVEINDGYLTQSTTFEYTASTATMDPSGTLAQYNKVITRVGTPAEGRTEHYFFNGLDNTQLAVDYPVDTTYSNAGSYLTKVQGLMYKTRAYTNGSTLLSETTNHYKVREKPIRRSPGNWPVDMGYYVRQYKTETTTEGVTTYANTTYDASSGLTRTTETSNYSIDGDEIVHKTEYRYAFEQYSALNTQHVLSPVIEQISSIKPEGSTTATITSKQVSTWQDWGGGKWAPYRSYNWKGTGSHVFNYSNPGSNWFPISEIVSRNTYGASTEVIDSDGISGSTVYGFEGTRPISSFTNASLTEVAADGFDEHTTPSGSALGWTSYNTGTWTIVDGELQAQKSGSGQAWLHANSAPRNHSDSILEFDARFTAGGNDDWLGLQFRLSGSGHGPSSGHYLKLTKAGILSVVGPGGTTLGSSSIPDGSTQTWRHIRLVTFTNGRIDVYLDGEHMIDVQSSTGINNPYYGFVIDAGAIARFDNFRIYPNDAVAQSTGYNQDYWLVNSETNAEGYTTSLIRDQNQRVKEVQDARGMIISSSSAVLSRQRNFGMFSSNKPNATFSATYPSFNAIRNSGGEYGDIDNPTYWDISGGGNITRSIGTVYSGLGALKYQQSTGGELVHTLADNTFLWQGKNYVVRFWIKTNGFVPSAPTITVKLSKSGSSVTAEASQLLTSERWTLFEAELNTNGGQFYSWNNRGMESKLVISSNISMSYLVDEVYLGKMAYSGESAPSWMVRYSNALGQPLQSQTWNGTDYTISHTEYDVKGRTWKTWHPYTQDTKGAYDTSPPSTIVYAQQEYYPDPLSRLQYQYPDGSNPTERTEYTYGSGQIHGVSFPYSQVTDLGGVISRTYVDYQRQGIRSETAMSTSEHSITESWYDPVARTGESRPPHYFDPPSGTASDWATISTSNFMGTQVTTITPDAGTVVVKNNEQERLRFSQTAGQAANGTVSFTRYDALGRPTHTGEAQASFSGLDAGQIHAFENDNHHYIQVSAYDEKPSAGTFPWSLFSSQMADIDLQNTLSVPVAQAHKGNGVSGTRITLGSETITTDLGATSVPGQITVDGMYTIEPGGSKELTSGDRVILKSGFRANDGSHFKARADQGLYSGVNNDKEWQAVFYSYDFQGRLAKKWTLIQDKPELRSEQSYIYNDAGQVIRQHTKIGTSQNLYHFYTYNALGRIEQVFVNTTSSRPTSPVANYAYNAEGKLVQRHIEGVDKATVSYIYDDQGRLDSMYTTSDRFEQAFSYNPDGTILKIDAVNNAFAQNAYSYIYSYDALNRMTQANYSSPLDLPPHLSRDVRNITYDKHGNILTLDRYRESSALTDDLTYHYEPGKNQLASVADAVATTTGLDWDAEDETFSYDKDGNLVSSDKTGGGGLEKITYGASNRPNRIQTGQGLEAVYRYNAEGWRTSSQVTDIQNGKVSEYKHYIMDGATVLAVADENGVVQHWNLYGNGLIGRQKADGERRFYVNDHLGSVRQVIDDYNTVKEGYDYYPFGLLLSASFDEATKEGFTGKERDDETGLHYFGARYYNAALGRWSVIDPKAHHFPEWSPYNAMLDDPINNIDPDGEFVLNLISKIVAGDIDNVHDVFRTIYTGSITDPINMTRAVNPINLYSTLVGITSGVGNGVFNGDWEKLGNTGEIFLGQFYTDNNRSVLGEIWQGVSRSTWELPQTTLGYNYSQWRNTTGNVDRVDLFAGATFVTKENQKRTNGVSIGNFINLNIGDEIDGSFEDRVINDPLFMHEYGHTFDSQIFGPLYLPVVGLPSLISAATSRQVPGEPPLVTTHDFRWFEMSANRHAARYFGRHYSVDWNTPIWRGWTYETFYPRRRR